MRLLVIISADYGELSVARYFLTGLGIDPKPVMLVPTALHQIERIEVDADVRSYVDLNDVLRAIETTDPEKVLLLSGYLLTIGPRFSLLNLLRLFRLLRRRGTQIITSDPFIGLLRSPRSLRFTGVLQRSNGRQPGVAQSIRGTLLSIRAYLIYLQLRHDLHIYPARIEQRFLNPYHRALSFFNKDALTGPDESHSADLTPVWLFVLSQVDFNFQVNRSGESFSLHVGARLRDAVRPGRRVILIGPSDLLEMLRSRAAGDGSVELRDSVPYSEYMQLLLQAERVFLWNYYSFSILYRVLAERPVYYFDQGHGVAILPALDQTGIDTYYGGWRPPLLALDEPFDESRLDEIARETQINFARMKAHMIGELSPRALLEQANEST